VKAFVETLSSTDIMFVSAVAIAELNFGAQLYQTDTGYPSTHATDVLAGAHSYTIRDITRHTGPEYGSVKAKVAFKYLKDPMDRKYRKPWVEEWIDRNSGGPLKINEGDLWMCAQARERNLILVTTDQKLKRISNADPTVQIKEII
jgi:predicted nucleic acid-binding protein